MAVRAGKDPHIYYRIEISLVNFDMGSNMSQDPFIYGNSNMGAPNLDRLGGGELPPLLHEYEDPGFLWIEYYFQMTLVLKA